MATQNSQSSSSATTNLALATARLLQETDTADITLVCGAKEWRLHSWVLAMRSPFFKAAMTNDMLEKRKKIISIEELDPKVMQQVIDYMHGLPIEVESIHCLPDIMEAVDRFLMADMKSDVTDIAIRSITMENAVELGKLAEENSMDKVLEACVEYIAENDVKIREELTPKFANTMVSFLKKSIKKSGNMKGKRHLSVWCDGCGLKPLVGFRYKCVTCDNYDLCGNCESAGIHSQHNMVRIASPDPHHKVLKTDNHDYDADVVLYAVRR